MLLSMPGKGPRHISQWDDFPAGGACLTHLCRRSPGNDLELDVCLFDHYIYNLREPLRGRERQSVGFLAMYNPKRMH